MTGRLILDAIAILLGATGGVAGLLTLRQRKALLTAQAGDVAATGQARIMDAAGRIVEQQADLVPDLLARIAALEAREEDRTKAVDEARQHSAQADAQVAALRVEVDHLWRFVDEATRWMAQALRVIQELGGEMPPPPDAPTLTRPAATAG